MIVLMPGDVHVALAERAVSPGAHFVSSNCIAPDMRALDPVARDASVAFVNGIGLDPGIDHRVAHKLVAAFRGSDASDRCNEMHFPSDCGGASKVPNAFRYKLSWSPLGVLEALRSPSRSLHGGAARDLARPWDALERYTAPVPQPKTFEVYPDRDSLPFLKDCIVDPTCNTRTFVRGILRLDGRAKAWAPVLAEIDC